MDNYEKNHKIYLEAFMNGELKELYQIIKDDDSIGFKLYFDKICIKVYYRGRKLFEISKDNKVNKYKIKYDITKSIEIAENILNLISKGDPCYIVDLDLTKIINGIKVGINKYYSKKSGNENEIRQIIVKENNKYRTDYYMIDEEYNIKDKKYENNPDIIGLYDKRNNTKKQFTLSLIELKVGKSTSSGENGIYDHFIKINEILSNKEIEQKIKKDAEHNFKIRVELGLINLKPGSTNISKAIDIKEINLVFIIANCVEQSEIFKNEIEKIKEISNKNIDVMFAISSFMGYGLYGSKIYTLEEFEKYLDVIKSIKE